MGNALVIKGVNFSTNKLATVVIGDVVPCESLSVVPNIIAFSAIGMTQQLSATALPSNTTDTIEWGSSNTDVATVANGLVTCVGVGSATITATCGEQTATCLVTSSVTVDADTAFIPIHRRCMQSTDLENSKDYIGISQEGEAGSGSNVARTRQYVSSDTGDGYYHIFSGTPDGQTEWFPIPLPNNTHMIRITSVDFDKQCGIVLVSGKEQPVYNISKKGAKAITDIYYETERASDNSYEFDISSYSGFDSFAFYLRIASGGDDSICTNPVTVTFM